MKVVRTISDARTALAGLPRPLGLVPTMGAFHEGHLALIRAARAGCASVAVSLFVNPTQFDDPDDLETYPRDEQRDLDLAASEGVDIVFAPAPAEMYRPGAATTVSVGGPLTERLEADERPGFFAGVATIVTKLLTVVGPDRAYFGRKDAQQLAVVRRLCDDLDLPVEVVALETVREPDGLAMSSRNAHLDAARRARAADLYRALQAGREVASHGRTAIINEVTGRLILGFGPELHDASFDVPAGPDFSIDYVDVVDPETFERVWEPTPESLIVAAARLKDVRLIDNLVVGPFAEPQAGDTPGAATAPLTANTTVHATDHTTDPTIDQEAATPLQARTTEEEA